MAATTTITVPVEVRDRLKSLARADGRTLADEIATLVKDAEEQRKWAEVHAAYDRLKADPQAWADYLAEGRTWTDAPGDGVWTDHQAAREEWPEYNS